MKPTTILKTIMLGFLLVGLSEATMAQQRPDRDTMNQRMERMHDFRMHRAGMPRLPDLTDDQKEQIQSIKLATQQDILPLENQLYEKHARLKTLSTAEEIDMDAIDTVIEEIGAIRTEIMKKRVASQLDIRELLTDEQRVIFDSRGMDNMLRMHRFHRGR